MRNRLRYVLPLFIATALQPAHSAEYFASTSAYYQRIGNPKTIFNTDIDQSANGASSTSDLENALGFFDTLNARADGTVSSNRDVRSRASITTGAVRSFATAELSGNVLEVKSLATFDDILVSRDQFNANLNIWYDRSLSLSQNNGDRTIYNMALANLGAQSSDKYFLSEIEVQSFASLSIYEYDPLTSSYGNLVGDLSIYDSLQLNVGAGYLNGQPGIVDLSFNLAAFTNIYTQFIDKNGQTVFQNQAIDQSGGFDLQNSRGTVTDRANYFLPARFGSGQYALGLWSECRVRFFGVATLQTIGSGLCDASNSLYWNGLTDVESGSNAPATGLLTSLTGDFDYLDASPLSPQLPGAVPEPHSWAMFILGFCAVGGALRRARARKQVVLVSGNPSSVGSILSSC